MTFESLVDRISPKLKGIVHKLNGHFSFFDDDDLYQEALTHLWLLWKIDQFLGKNDSYILQGCFYYLKNYLRTHLDRVPLLSIDALLNEEEGASLEDLLPATFPRSALDSVDDRLIRERFNERGLTETERKAANFFLDGLTTREIGNRLGVSHVMVIKIKKRIRLKCGIFFRSGYQS